MPTTVVSRHLRLSMELFKTNTILTKTAAYYMTPRDTDLKVDSTLGGFQVWLPPVAECAGMQYVIRQIASANTVTITDRGDASVAVNSTITSATGALSFLSNGERWFLEFTVV